MTFNEPNIKIVGGVEAIPNSWPSMALVVFRYRYSYTAPNGQIINGSVRAYCSGSLIDRSTVMIASHCYTSEIYRDDLKLVIPIRPNQFYPTIESMYTVYLGLHELRNALAGQDVSPGISVGIKKFIRVKISSKI